MKALLINRRLYLYPALIICCLIACTEESDVTTTETGNNGYQLEFNIETPSYSLDESLHTRTGEDMEVHIDMLSYYIMDESRNLITPMKSQVVNGNRILQLDGLSPGRYTITFLARSRENKLVSGTTSGVINEESPWVSFDADEKLAVDGEYFWASHSFNIIPGQRQQLLSVQLERKIGRIDVNIDVERAVNRRLIRKVEVTFNEPTAAAILANGHFAGKKLIKKVDITDTQSIYALPSPDEDKVSGIIRLTMIDSDSILHYQDIAFDDCLLQANRISVIKVKMQHHEDENGKIYIFNEDYTPVNSRRILTDSEPDNILFNANHRSFYIDQPLQVGFIGDSLLHVRFYSARPIRHVKIMAMYAPVSSEYFEIAEYEEIYALHDSEIPFTLLKDKEMKYRTETGRIIVFPPMTSLDKNRLSLKIVCEDPYWKKIKEIKAHWKITFSAYGTSATKPANGNWRYIRPKSCRGAIALFTNIAWMNETERYRQMLVAQNGKYWLTAKQEDGSQTFLQDNLVLINQLRNLGGLAIGECGGVLGLGGGNTMGLVGYIFTTHYNDTDPSGYIVHTVFHELGHCMGYGHQTAMTYGNWAQGDCNILYRDLSKEGELPVSESKWLSNFNY